MCRPNPFALKVFRQFRGAYGLRQIVLLYVLGTSLPRLAAQLTPVNPGMAPFSAYDRHPVDTVNLINNNILLAVPIRSQAQKITFGVAANSYMAAVGGAWLPSMSIGVGGRTGAPFNYAAYGLLGQGIGLWFTTSTPGATCNGWGTTKYSGFYIFTADGTIHPFDPTVSIISGRGTGCPTSTIFTTIDGSGFTVSVYGSVNLPFANWIYLRNGTQVTQNELIDANGNAIQQQSSCASNSTSCNWIDAMGLTAISMTTPNGIAEPQFSWTDVNGGSPTVSQLTTNYTLKTAFGCANITDLNNSTALPMTTGFSFPDGTSLGITYEGATNNSTGRVNKITLREGGSVTYTYSGGSNGIDCTYQNAPVLTRTLGNGDQTTYTLTHNLISTGPNYNAVNTVVDPGGNETDYTFTGFTSTGLQASPVAQVLTQILRYQGHGTGKTLLETEYYCYNPTQFTSCSQSGSVGATVSYPVSSVIRFRQLSGMSIWAATEVHYDGQGNVIYSAQYDFGATTPSLARTTTYGTWNGTGCGYIGNNIYSAPCDIYTSQNGVAIAESHLTYSQYGNLITTSVWNGSSWIGQTTANSYNSNGTPSKTYDLANNETDYSYSAASYLHCSSPSCTQYPFPTKILNVGTGDYTSTEWYGDGGVKYTDTDRNGNIVTYGYATSGGTADPYWRVSSITDPYSSVAYYMYPTGSSPTTSGYSFTFDSGNSIEADTITVDGYDRIVNSQVAQTPGGANYDTMSQAYSWTGNYFTVQWNAPPCSTSTVCAATHTQELDPLGRPYTTSTTSNETVTHTYTQNDDLAVLTPAPSGENTKQLQTEYDGLGRISKICQIGNGSSTACNQNSGTSKGVTDAYTYSPASGSTTVTISRESQTRSQTFDALGRLTQKITPEGGTWNYYYDTVASACSGTSASAGNLTCSKDPNGNQVVYSYDSLNRLTDVGAGTGSSTACRRFRYDNTSGVLGTVPNGITLANQYGRLVEAETDDCTTWPVQPSSQITDEWFAYDKDGRVTDMWEWTKHSTQYYHSVATFFENGMVNTLQLASPSIYTMTYGLDGEGRWNTVSDTTHNKSFVTGATFFPAANPAVITIAASDSDKYTYDTNTGNITQYQFNVGSSSMTAALAWNPNGTLKQLAITDGFNTGGTQTCNYNPSSATGTGYDDFLRLIGVDCGSGGWGQTFSYDDYDNLSKVVMSGHTGTTWSPGYSSSTNHYSIGSYDSNGNVTSDGNFVYGWNEFSKLKWSAASGTPTCGTSGRCITYDAFGRIVETSVNSIWKTRWITQLGETANMSGTTINFAYWPAPEGGTAYENANGGAYLYMHKDWLGSARVLSSVGHSVFSDQAFSPYGEIYDSFGSVLPAYDMFAGLTANFYPGAMSDTPNRELSMVGRWLSPDPANQTWNRYAYVANNPLSFVDPTGLYLSGPNHGCEQASGDPCGGSDLYGGGGGGWAGGSDFCDASGNCSSWGISGINGVPWNWGPGYAGQSTFGLGPLLQGELSYLQQIAPSLYGPGSNVTLGPNGFVISMYVYYWAAWLGNCSGDAFCIGRNVVNLFQFTDPTETKSFSFDTSFANTVVAFGQAGVTPSSLDNKYNRFHPADSYHLRDSLPYCSLHVILNSLGGGSPTAGTIHIDSVNPLFGPWAMVVHTFSDLIPDDLFGSGGNGLCQ